MSDAEQGPTNPSEFLADIAVRLIEGDLLADRAWRVAYVLGYVLDSAVAETSDDIDSGDLRDLRTFSEDLVVDIVNLLLYAHVHEVPTEADIEDQARQFTEMLTRAEELRTDKKEED